ncbi:unnamed protein product [Gongylonema pulchrum]|uniref:Uncharacterized protein n=1 Tax=Gongylonema pulchrum TaxID=637853 RepID=A0A183EYZ8_9BILA|nr:unnamed protein product [Gongylonema pulchrum]
MDRMHVDLRHPQPILYHSMNSSFRNSLFDSFSFSVVGRGITI